MSAALGTAATVCNVGAGAGSYEPTDRAVVAVEPSATMRAQRPAGAAPVVAAVAEALPFAGGAFDAAMATFSVHQWEDLDAGLGELRRVARGPVAVLTGDPDRLDAFWLADYCPEVLEVESRRYPSLGAAGRGARRPGAPPGGPGARRLPRRLQRGLRRAAEALLDPGARRSCSAWSFVTTRSERFEAHWRDLADGTWERRYGHLRDRDVRGLAGARGGRTG